MTATVYLSDQQSLLSRFTQGLAGRYLHLKSTEMLTGSFRPEGGTTDGFAIYLPDAVSAFESQRDNLSLYKVSILHQLGYYQFGTFEFSIDVAASRLGGLPDPPVTTSILRRFDDQPVDLELFFERFEHPKLAQRLFLLLEDYRIDCRLPEPYPGISDELDRMMAHALVSRESIDRGASVAARLLDALARFSLGAAAGPLVDADSTGLLPGLIDQMYRLSASSTDVYDTAAATWHCHDALIRWATRQRDADRAISSTQTNDNGDDGFSSIPLLPEGDIEIGGADFRGDVMPEMVQRRIRLADTMAETDAIEEMGQHFPPELLAEHLGHLRSDFDPATIENADGRDSSVTITDNAADTAETRPAGAEALARVIRDELDASHRRSLRDESILRRAFGEVRRVTRSYFYDEWDYHQQNYRKGWCRLYEQRLHGDDRDYFRRVHRRHRLLAATIENQLRRIRAESLARVKRVTDGDELDLDQLLVAAVDRRAGLVPDDRVYSRKERTKREVAAAFLLDMSASTDDSVPDPEAMTVDLARDPTTNTLTHDWSAPESTRKVIDVEKDALVLISEALSMLGDAYAIYGFSGYGRDEVDFYVAKEFDDGLNGRTKSALAAMEPKRSTRMGPAIRHTVRRLQQQDAPLKVLIMLSDGFPQDSDYGPDRNDHEYGIQDTAKAIREAEDRGIATFCITVDQSGHDYLRRMCIEDRYLVIDEIESLPAELNKIYQRLTV